MATTFRSSGKSVSGGKLTRVMRGGECVGTINETSVGVMAHTSKDRPAHFVVCDSLAEAKDLFRRPAKKKRTASLRRATKRSKPKPKRKRARRRKLLGRVRKTRARIRRRRSAPKPVYAHERVYHPGDRVVAVNSIYEGAEGVVVRDIGTGIEWRITSNARVKMPEYAPVGQVVSTRKNYMDPA